MTGNKKEFVHLHVHSEYSLLDGAGRIPKLVERAIQLGMPALAITDHGVMYGVVDFYKACREKGVKPILGCEVYVAPRSRYQKEGRLDDTPFHLVLLAETQEGYRNLMELVSRGFTEGFYYKPRVDKELLARYSRGLIALSACLAGEVAAYILQEQREDAVRVAAEYRDIFGPDSFYLELQDHGYAEQKKVNRELLEISARTGIPVVATNDVHYCEAGDAELHDILLCIQTGKTLYDTDRMRFEGGEFYLKSREEMELLFGEVPEALNNTLVIAERCQVELEFNRLHLPHYELPPGYDEDTYLEMLCREGLVNRYGPEPPEEIRKRLEYELSVIKQMGFSGYFLIVWDFVRFARERGIPVGPGRGSAAGSLVAYVLGITNIDPVRYGLLFERFLNPERVSMPDIDIDFCFERRDEVIRYVVEKYGADRVAQIITFGTMAARAAVRDVGRVLGLPYGEVDRLAKMVPPGPGVTISKALEVNPVLREVYEGNDTARRVLDLAAALEGMPRHASIHAAGVVIAKEELTHYLPLYRTSDGVVTTQFPKETVEELGLLKMDLLGLRTLTVIGHTVELIEARRGIKLDLENLPLDDEKTYRMLSRGESIGVFQLESSGMRNLLRELKPENFEDLIALVALYRPGPLGSGMVEDFINRKHGRTPITYLHPSLEPILKDTYGVILYQEQVMRIASDLAGFTLGEADLLRRAMGKKKPEIIAGLREQFVEGAVVRGIDRETAGQIFDLMEYFAGYGFNKSHSAAYALVAYQTAYLKANYPLEYMTALLTSVLSNSDRVALYIEECRRMGIEVLPPDVNESDHSFTIVGDRIRFGLGAIKNVGQHAVEAIIAERAAHGPYTSLMDFCQRLDLRVINRRVLESLIKGGAMESLPGNRAQKLAVLDQCLELAQKKQEEREKGQISLFEALTGAETEELWAEEIEFPNLEEFPSRELLSMEKEMLGLYISGHPLAACKEALEMRVTWKVGELAEQGDGAPGVIGGMVAALREVSTRQGERMAFLVLEDLTGSVEVVVFPSLYRQVRLWLEGDQVVLMRGKIDRQEEEVKFLADEILPLPEGNESLGGGKKEKKGIFLRVEDKPAVRKALYHLLQAYRGDLPVFIKFSSRPEVIQARRDLWIEPREEVIRRLRDLLGNENVAFL